MLSVDIGLLAVYITTAQDSVMAQRDDSVSVMLSAATDQQTRHTKWSLQMAIKCEDNKENSMMTGECV